MEKRSVKLRLLEWLHHFGISDDGLYYFLTVLVGVVAGLCAVAFHLILGMMHTIYFGSHDLSHISRAWYIVPLIPAGGAFLAAILLLFVPEARGSGIPQTKIAYIVRNGTIPIRVWLGKFFIGAQAKRRNAPEKLAPGLVRSVNFLY